jgi:SH3-like domain-containing protein
MAQTATNTTPQTGTTGVSTPAPARNSSTGRRSGTTTRRGAAPAAQAPPAAPLVTNELAIAKQNNINVRAQPKINSEIVAKLKQGEEVLVLEEITIKSPKVDEPARWARIKLPSGPHVWVNSSYLDANHTVTPAKLNVRAGAGENFSIVGVLHKGDTVKVVETKAEWTAIETPDSAYAFVAAHLLTAKPPVVIPVPPTTTTIVENPPPITAATNLAMNTNAVTPTGVVPVVPEPKPAPVDDGPPPKRIVQREGVIGGTVSIQAPSYYQLESLETGKPIDYLYSTSTNLVLSRYKGKTVLVTGEESLDERWANTPVLTISKIQLVQ